MEFIFTIFTAVESAFVIGSCNFLIAVLFGAPSGIESYNNALLRTFSFSIWMWNVIVLWPKVWMAVASSSSSSGMLFLSVYQRHVLMGKIHHFFQDEEEEDRISKPSHHEGGAEMKTKREEEEEEAKVPASFLFRLGTWCSQMVFDHNAFHREVLYLHRFWLLAVFHWEVLRRENQDDDDQRGKDHDGKNGTTTTSVVSGLSSSNNVTAGASGETKMTKRRKNADNKVIQPKEEGKLHVVVATNTTIQTAEEVHQHHQKQQKGKTKTNSNTSSSSSSSSCPVHPSLCLSISEECFLSSISTATFFGLFGAWGASLFIPLDWGLWWQQFPIPNIAFGSLFYFLYLFKVIIVGVFLRGKKDEKETVV